MNPQEWAERFLYMGEEEALLKRIELENLWREENRRFNSNYAHKSATTPLTPFDLPYTATQADVLRAFRLKVKAMANGKGDYSGDMHALVLLKEKALAFVAGGERA